MARKQLDLSDLTNEHERQYVAAKRGQVSDDQLRDDIRQFRALTISDRKQEEMGEESAPQSAPPMRPESSLQSSPPLEESLDTWLQTRQQSQGYADEQKLDAWLKDRAQGGSIKSVLPGEYPENPPVGGISGGISGALTGARVTPGGPVLKAIGAAVGAFLGAAGGQFVQGRVEQYKGDKLAPRNFDDEVFRMMREGTLNLAFEAGGQAAYLIPKAKYLANYANQVTPEARLAQQNLERMTGVHNPHFMPAEMTSSRLLDILNNVAEYSFFGGGWIKDFKDKRDVLFTNMSRAILSRYGPHMDPDEIGRAVVDSAKYNLENSKVVSGMIYDAIESQASPVYAKAPAIVTVEKQTTPITKTAVDKVTVKKVEQVEKAAPAATTKEAEAFGESLVGFLRNKGGLQDQGGEVGKFEIQGKPGQKGLIKPEGMTLDRAAEAAHEAGYIPEANINSLLDAIRAESRGKPVYSAARGNEALQGDVFEREFLAAHAAHEGELQEAPEIRKLLGMKVRVTSQDMKVMEKPVVGYEVEFPFTGKKTAPYKTREEAEAGAKAIGLKQPEYTINEIYGEEREATQLKRMKVLVTEQENQVGGTRIDMRPLKDAFAARARTAKEAGGLEDKAMGNSVLAFIQSKPDFVSYPVAKAIRTEVRVLADMLKSEAGTKNAPAIGLIQKSEGIYKTLTNQIRKGLEDDDPFLAQMWDEANLLEAGANQQFNTSMTRELIKLADRQGKNAPEAVAEKVWNPKRTTDMKVIRNSIDPSAWQKLQQIQMERMWKEATPDNIPDYKKFKDAFFGQADEKIPMLEAGFDKATVKELKDFYGALKVAQEKHGEGVGKVLVMLQQGRYGAETAAFALSAIGLASEEAGTLTPIAGAVILTPAVLSYIFTHPGAIRWMTEALTTSPKTAKGIMLTTQLMKVIQGGVQRTQEVPRQQPPGSTVNQLQNVQ